LKKKKRKGGEREEKGVGGWVGERVTRKGRRRRWFLCSLFDKNHAPAAPQRKIRTVPSATFEHTPLPQYSRNPCSDPCTWRDRPGGQQNKKRCQGATNVKSSKKEKKGLVIQSQSYQAASPGVAHTSCSTGHSFSTTLKAFPKRKTYWVSQMNPPKRTMGRREAPLTLSNS